MSPYDFVRIRTSADDMCRYDQGSVRDDFGRRKQGTYVEDLCVRVFACVDCVLVEMHTLLQVLWSSSCVVEVDGQEEKSSSLVTV